MKITLRWHTTDALQRLEQQVAVLASRLDFERDVNDGLRALMTEINLARVIDHRTMHAGLNELTGMVINLASVVDKLDDHVVVIEDRLAIDSHWRETIHARLNELEAWQAAMAQDSDEDDTLLGTPYETKVARFVLLCWWRWCRLLTRRF